MARKGEQERWMGEKLWKVSVRAGIVVLGLALAVSGRAQSNGPERTGSSTPTASEATSPHEASAPAGVDAGNYHLESTIEAGWRYSNFTGNLANYDTFINL